MNQEKNVDKQISNEDIFNLLNKSIHQNNEMKEEIKAEIVELRREIHGNNEAIKVLKDKLTAVESDNIKIYNTLLRIERKQKQNNLIIFGFPETSGEILTDSIVKFVELQLGINLNMHDVNNIYRLTTRNSSKGPRPVILELVTFMKKQEIMQQKRRLKGTHLVISDDLPQKDRIERKLLYDYYTSARNKGCSARLLHNKVEINGKYYTYSDLCEKKLRIGELSNPGTRSDSASSTPGTTSKGDRFNFNFAVPSSVETQLKERSDIKEDQTSLQNDSVQPTAAANTRLRTNSKSGLKAGSTSRNKAVK